MSKSHPDTHPYGLDAHAPIPRAFLEAVDRARGHLDTGQLVLMALEIVKVPWRVQARWRIVEALWDLEQCRAAARVYALIADECPGDAEANLRLSMLCQPRNEQKSNFGLVLVGTGHRIDPPGRAEPRFPANKEGVARAALRAAVSEATVDVKGPTLGLSALASGADILFQEVCAELNIHTEALLPLPPEDFKAASVADAGSEWSKRFDVLMAKLENVRVLGESETPPPWLQSEAGYSVFQRGNFWLLESAFAVPQANVALIALWNGAEAEGTGGTADMVKAARERGAGVQVLDTQVLFDL